MRRSVFAKSAALAMGWFLAVLGGCSAPSKANVADLGAAAGRAGEVGTGGASQAVGGNPSSSGASSTTTTGGGGSSGGGPFVAGGSETGGTGTTANQRPFVYVGTSFYDEAPKTLVVLQLDPAQGQLSVRQTITDLEGIPSWIAIAPSHQFLYVNLEDVPALAAFKIDQTNGTLTRLGTVATKQQSSAYLSLDLTGRFALQANYNAGTASVVAIGNDGGLGAVVDTLDFGPGSFPHSILVDPSNQFALVMNRGDQLSGNEILQFKFDATTGKLTPNQTPKLTFAPGTGPRHLEFHPRGKFAYATYEKASAVGVLSWDATQGTLQPVQQVSTVPKGVSGAAPTDIHVHPSGRFVYAINRNQWSIALFSVDPASAKLTFVEHTQLGSGNARNFALDPHGAFLVVGHLEGNAVRVFSINQDSGKLTLLGTPAELPSPSGIALTYLP